MKRRKFKIGHLYTLIWDDHWRANEVQEEFFKDTEDTIRIRTTGVLVRETKKSLLLESQRALSKDANWRASAHGILRADLLIVIDHGKAKE